MPLTAAAAVGLALALDLAFAEPPERVHPVALFGRLVAPVDRAWRRPEAAGALAALGLPLLFAAVAAGAVALAGRVHPWTGVAAAGLVLFSATSLRMLLAVAREAVDLSEADLQRARERLRALAGRDAADLDADEVRSAAVESAAENLADGLVGPLLAFALVARLVPAPAASATLALAAGAAAWVKGVDTLDSMLGYPSKPVGRASARLDDLVMWVPARLSAVLLALAARDPDSLGLARRWARAPPSPNSGWPMAALAAILHVKLVKPGSYTLNPAAQLPTVREARRGVRTVGVAGLLAYLVGGVVAWS